MGEGPKDSENTLNSFLTKNKEKVFWQIGADMYMNITYVGHSDFLFESKAKDQIVQNISLLLEVVGLRKLFDQLFQT